MRFAAFDGLRGFFSLFVVLAHIPAATFLHSTSLQETGKSLVDLFFVFSGFVIVAGYEKHLRDGYGTRRFLIERLGRIYPIHFLMMMVFLATEIAFATVLSDLGQPGRQAFDASKSPETFISNLLLIQAWGVNDRLAWNFPSWSLSTEWAAYIFFALAMMLAPKRFWPIAIVGLVASMVILAFVSPYGMHSYSDYAVFRSILGFSAGAIAYYIYSAMAQREMLTGLPKLCYTIIEACGIVLLITAQIRLGTSPYAVLLPLMFIALMIVFAYGRGAISDVMSTKPMVYLGVISLSVYVIHAWIIMRVVNFAQLFDRLTGSDIVRNDAIEGTTLALSPMAADALGVAIIVVVIAISHFTYTYVEVPGQRMFRRFAKRYAAAPVQSSGPSAVIVPMPVAEPQREQTTTIPVAPAA